MNLDDLLKSIKEEDDDSKGGKDLDDLLESIREEGVETDKKLDEKIESIREESAETNKKLDDLLESIKNDSNDKKIDATKFLQRKTFENPLKGQRFTAPEIIQTRSTSSKIKTDKIIPKDAVIGEEIAEKLDELIQVIREDNKLEEDSQKLENKEKEKEKREKREDRIESKKEIKSYVINLKKSTSKVSGFFDNLKDFLTKVLLGGIINTLYNYFTDPKNKDKISEIQEFFRNYWPAVLGAVAYFFTPFGTLVNFVVGTVGKFLLKLGLLVAKNPILAAALGGAALGIAGSELAKKRQAELRERRKDFQRELGVKFFDKETGEPLTDRDREFDPTPFIDTPDNPVEIRQRKVGFFEKLFNTRDLLIYDAPPVSPDQVFFGDGVPTGMPMSREALGFSRGGMKMGTDTVPALLTPGEVVMNKPTVDAVGAENLLSLNKIFGGPNANRPKFGMVRGYQGGGYVGFAKKMIQEHEGYNIVDGMHQAYRDSKGLPTIGYGHLITPGDGYSMSSKISQQEADKLFDKDFKYHSEHAQKIPGFEKASDQQKAALIDLTFNMGPAWHKDFPGFVRAFSSGDYETAANEIRYKDASSPNLQDSDYYKDVGPRRANPIISLIRNQGIGNSPHLKGFQNLLPVSKSTDGGKPVSTRSLSTAPGSLGPAFSDNTSMKDLSKQQLVRDRLSSIGRKLSNPIDTFIRTPLKRAFPSTPNVPTETRNFVLPPIESPKQNQSKNQTGDIPSFSVVSGNMMRDLIAKDLGIGDLAGVS